ncbi:MAG: hypothetical protein R3Y63_03780 [Eubacteriales bacterium]
MGILDIAIIAFVCMELSNVIILYFYPEFPYGNGVAVFRHWEKSKEDEATHLFARYMADWVAGVKLIFIFLLVVVVIVGDERTKIWAVVAMILSILSYFFRLHPTMKKLDQLGELKPAGYSKSLDLMIIGFLLLFIGALCLHFFLPVENLP